MKTQLCQIQNVNAYLHTLEDNIRKMMDTKKE